MVKNWLAALLIVLFISSCGKDELNTPVKAQLVLEMETQQENPNDKLVVTGARLMLLELGFDGYREDAESYFFDKNFPDTLSVSFSKNAPGVILDFEMPQGVYNRINIGLKVPAGKEASLQEPVLQTSSIKGGVQIWGNYINTHDEAIPFIFVYTAVDEYNFRATTPGGSEEVVVKDKANYKASLRFKPDSWLDLINPRMLQSAKLVKLNGVPTIIISKTHNDHIYNLLANRIDKSSTLLFE